MKLSELDKNLAVETNIQREGLRFYDVEQAPFAVYGVKMDDGCYRRMPEAVAKTVNAGVHRMHTHTAGGRVRFVTDSPYIAISAQMSDLGKMDHFAFTGSIGFDLFTHKHYCGTYRPDVDITDGYESVLDLPEGGEREYTINFPLYSNVHRLYIGLKEGSTLKPAGKYPNPKPVVYYGSSITQGGCASRPGNSYQSIISRELNCDYINLGFSGSARGEDTMAGYIAGLEMSAFVYDYDHNAPDPQHLLATHARMFQTIRAAQPNLPILMLSRPKYYLSPEDEERLKIVRATYENAVAAGDKNVYFIPGPELIGEQVRETALVDHCHPNDSGFVSMAAVIGAKLKTILP